MGRTIQIKDRLKKIRLEHQVSQATLAKALFVKNTTISNWENGTRSIHLEALQQISEYFKVPITYFTEGNQPNVSSPSPLKSIYTLSAVIALIVSSGVFLFTRSPNLAIDACYGEINCYLIEDNELISELSSRQISGGLMTNVELERVYDYLEDYRWMNEENLQSNAHRMMIETYMYFFNHDYKTYNTDQYYQFIGYFVNEDAIKAQNYLDFEVLNLNQKQYFIHEDVKYILYKTGFESYVFEVFSDSYYKYVIDIDFDAIYFGEQRLIKGLETIIEGMLKDSRQTTRVHGDGSIEYFGWKYNESNQLHFGSSIHNDNVFGVQAHIYDYVGLNWLTIEYSEYNNQGAFTLRMDDSYFHYVNFALPLVNNKNIVETLKAFQDSDTPLLSQEANASFETLAPLILPFFESFDFSYIYPPL